MKIILPIHPIYAEKIKSGEKVFELRKSFPKNVCRVYIYETSPIKKITCMFDVGKIIHDEIPVLLKIVNGKCGISKVEFIEYFKNRHKGFAIEICKLKILKSPIEFNWSQFYPKQFHAINSITDIYNLSREAFQK